MTNEMTQPSPETEIDVDGVIFTFADIYNVVNRFYTQVSNDPVLQVPFSSVEDWPHHIDRLTHFWWMRLGGRAYMEARYNPVARHFVAGFNALFLKRWLGLFHETQRELLRPEQAELWGDLASRMGQALAGKNEYLKQEYLSRS